LANGTHSEAAKAILIQLLSRGKVYYGPIGAVRSLVLRRYNEMGGWLILSMAEH
jgi:hypothetical protein